jgi:hypothetical protein
MTDIFLSYSREDRSVVDSVAEALLAAGYQVWWDREIPVGYSYDEFIRLQLQRAKAVVVAWSPQSAASEYVRWEALQARDRGVLVPILIEQSELPPEFFWVQAADLTDWDGDQLHPEWTRVLDAMARLGVEASGAERGKAATPSRRIGRSRLPSVKDLKASGPGERGETP